jgi:assimilatory nitrate reductase catalytic subunit
VIVSEVMNDTDTSRFAHIRFPALAWGEKDGTVTNSERRISRQRAFCPRRERQSRTGGSSRRWRNGWARRGLCLAASARDFCEHAALTAFENDGARALNLHDLATLTREEWERLSPGSGLGGFSAPKHCSR